MIRHVCLVCVCSVVREHCVGAEYMYFEMLDMENRFHCSTNRKWRMRNRSHD